MSELAAVVANNLERSRYEISVDDVVVGLADYYIIRNPVHGDDAQDAESGGETGPDYSDIVVIPHTETSPTHGGRGLASELIRFALDDISAAGRLIRPACPFVKVYIQRHPEYAHLVA